MLTGERRGFALPYVCLGSRAGLPITRTVWPEIGLQTDAYEVSFPTPESLSPEGLVTMTPSIIVPGHAMYQATKRVQDGVIS